MGTWFAHSFDAQRYGMFWLKTLLLVILSDTECLIVGLGLQVRLGSM